MHHLPPIEVLRQFSPESQALEIELARQDLDRDAAALLDIVANHHRDDWSDKRIAIKLRAIVKSVANHLRDRSNG